MSTNLKTSLSVVLAILLLSFSSCTNDPEPDLGPDFSINSSSAFEVVETYDNGWIKSAKQLFFNGSVKSEFEYHDNGYINSCFVYSDYPSYHLYMEVHRDVNNNPISSTYYNKDESINSSFEYQNGILSKKTVHSNNGTNVTSYTSGQISTITFTSADQTSLTEVVYSNNTRQITITNSGEVVFNNSQSIEAVLGEGAYSLAELRLANRFGDAPINSTNLLTASSSSIGWKNTLDPTQFIPVARLYKSYQNEFQPFYTDFCISTDVYREIIEQFPVSEDQLLISGYRYVDEQISLQPDFELRDAIKNERNTDINLFTQKYGNEFNNTAFTGKYLYIVGALRNLPTDQILRDEIKDAAYKRAQDLITGSLTIEANEQQLLDQVFFELKVFSSVMQDKTGVIIESFDDYNQVVQELDASENDVIQRLYQSYEYL